MNGQLSLLFDDRQVWLLLGGAYLAGSVNFSILIFKLLGRTDPRDKFSGNAGASNVYRQAGWLWALVVLLLDMGRAVAVAVAALVWMPQVSGMSWMGLGLIVGNRFPCFHRFRGGKGVANFLGFSMVITPVAALIGAMAWGIIFGLVRRPFVASFAMVAVLAVGAIGAWNQNPVAIMGTVVTAVLIYLSHWRNVVSSCFR